MQSGNDFSLSICNAITFESLGPESVFSIRRYIFIVFGSSLSVYQVLPVKVKVTGAKSVYVHDAAGDLAATGRPSCYYYHYYNRQQWSVHTLRWVTVSGFNSR